MKWNCGEHINIWEDYYNNNPRAIAARFHPHGDQKWIQSLNPKRRYWQDIYPDQIISYKKHNKGQRPIKEKIICFHGQPSIIEAMSKDTRNAQTGSIKKATWIKDHWRDSS